MTSHTFYVQSLFSLSTKYFLIFFCKFLVWPMYYMNMLVPKYLINNLISLWPEQILCITEIILNLLTLALWPCIWSTWPYSVCIWKGCESAIVWLGVLQIIRLSYNSIIQIYIFTDFLSISYWGIIPKSFTIIVNVSILTCNFISFASCIVKLSYAYLWLSVLLMSWPLSLWNDLFILGNMFYLQFSLSNNHPAFFWLACFIFFHLFSFNLLYLHIWIVLLIYII